MAALTLYHNPKCSKSRQAVELLADRGVEVDVVQYLKDPPSRAELERLLAGSDDPPAAFVRVKDAKFTALAVDPATLTSARAVVDLLVEHPEVMERPVLSDGTRTVIGRPQPERLLELLG